MFQKFNKFILGDNSNLSTENHCISNSFEWKIDKLLKI